MHVYVDGEVSFSALFMPVPTTLISVQEPENITKRKSVLMVPPPAGTIARVC